MTADASADLPEHTPAQQTPQQPAQAQPMQQQGDLTHPHRPVGATEEARGAEGKTRVDTEHAGTSPAKDEPTQIKR